ncbi:hypothetical protein HMPREF2978_00520 [Corynebacterium sp. HMSC074C01]|nr:hypothetical protein HMPREF2978_00520 [Corynebacterium sp. HMSC074C01]
MQNALGIRHVSITNFVEAYPKLRIRTESRCKRQKLSFIVIFVSRVLKKAYVVRKSVLKKRC